MASRALLSKLSSFPLLPASSRSFSSRFFSASPLIRIRPLVAPVDQLVLFKQSVITSHVSGRRSMSTHHTNSSLRDSSPNFSNRPPKETILLDGCDFEHWLVVMDPPPGDPSNPDITRDEIIDSYIKTLAKVIGSEEEARMKIYSVSTRHYFAFGALVSEELSYKIKELPHVRWVLPDSYLDVRNKDYGGEPFINGEAVPYDPKYHEEWVRNNARANERSRRNDRPRNFDRSRNFERRRENMQNFQNSPPPSNNMPPRDMPAPPPPPPSNFSNMPPPPQPAMGGGAPPGAYQQGMPGAYQPGAPPVSYLNQQMPPNPQQGGYERGPVYQGTRPPPVYGNPNPNPDQGNAYQGGPPNPNPRHGPGPYQGGGYQGGPPNQPYQRGGFPDGNQYQGGGPPQMGGGANYDHGGPGPYGGGGGGGGYPAYQGRDMPGRDHQ